MNFSQALELILSGKKLQRESWKNLKAIFFVDGSTFTVNRAPLNKIFPEGKEVQYRPHIDGIGTDGSVGVWVPSMVDILAMDWQEINEI